MEQPTAETRPTSIADLRPKMRLEGVVRKIELYGAFVDIGLERDGLIHISQLSEKPVRRVADVLKEGQRVTVWVTQVDPQQGRVALTMIKPPDVEWKDLAEGQTYVGRVVRVERYGLFVDIGAERPGFLHVREMGPFNRPEMYKVGDEVEVQILQVDRRKKRIDLTLSPTELPPLDEEVEVVSPIELAFRKALEEARREGREVILTSRRKKQPAAVSTQEEILSRTLQQLRK